MFLFFLSLHAFRVQVEETAGDRLLASTNKHKVVLHSDKKSSLGFSIRGGSEYGLGIYISAYVG